MTAGQLQVAQRHFVSFFAPLQSPALADQRSFSVLASYTLKKLRLPYLAPGCKGLQTPGVQATGRCLEDNERSKHQQSCSKKTRLHRGRGGIFYALLYAGPNVLSVHNHRRHGKMAKLRLPRHLLHHSHQMQPDQAYKKCESNKKD